MGAFRNPSNVAATKLGSVAIKGALDKINLSPEQVDEVLMGNVLQAGLGQAPAKQAALGAGIPDTVPCTTVNKVCSSGMKTVMMAAQAIQLGDAEIVVAGGMENMSLVPHYLHGRSGQKFGPVSMEDGMQKDGLVDPYDQVAMGVCAELCDETTLVEDQMLMPSSHTLEVQKHGKQASSLRSGTCCYPQRRGEDLMFQEDEE